MYWADNVRETTNTAGSGALTLIGPVRTYQTALAELGNSKLTPYFIRHRTLNEWERGLGQLTGGTTWNRTKVIGGSNGTSAVVFSVGVKDVYTSVSKEFIDGAMRLKTPCRVAATANVTIATALNNGDTLNGVTLATGDRVLLPFQTTTSQNGVYIVAASPERAADLFTGSQAAGVFVSVQSGTLYAGTVWHCTSAIGSDIVGTNSLTWGQVGAGTGDVVGPDPSTLNSIPRWDTTDGTELEDSELIIHPDANDKLETNATFMAWHTAVDGSTVTFDLDLTDKHDVTYAGDRILAVANASVGQRISLLRYQDGTGDHEETWFSNIAWDNGLAPVPDPTENGWDLVVLDCIGLDGYGDPEWVEVSRTSSAPRKGILDTTDGATVTFDLRQSPKRKVTLGGNRTAELAANCYYVGLMFALKFIQDGTGSRTITFGTTFGTIEWTATGGIQPTLSMVAGSYCWLCFVCTTAGGSPVFECVGASGMAAEAVIVSHLIGGTSAPAIAAGAGAGTGPTVSLTQADDLAGMVSVTTGTTPAGSSAVVVTLTFATPYTAAPNIVLTPANAATALLSGVTAVFVTSTTTTLVINSGSTGLVAATNYKWFYVAIQ